MAKSRGWRLGAAAGIAGVLALTACSNAGESPVGGAGTSDEGASEATSSGGEAAAGGDVTLEFMQWWEPELPEGNFRTLMDQFESENPGIKVELISGPWSQTKDQIIAGAASGTIADVVGLDGTWMYDLIGQGAIADLGAAFEADGFDTSKLNAKFSVDDVLYMVQVVNFAYPLFVNLDLLEQAGVTEPPTNRTEFLDAAAKIAETGNASGWALPISLEVGNGIQNDILPWVWAGGGTALDDSGQPDVENADVVSGLEFVKQLWDAGAVSPGAFSMAEQDKVEEFGAGRVGFMFSSLAHINLLRSTYPDLDFTVVAPPVPDGYTGEIGINTNSWGIGISENSEHKAEAAKLVEFLLGTDVNSQLSTWANGFPGNVDSTPDFSATDPLFEEAFDIFSAGYPMNEFVGAPVAQELQRQFATEVQKLLNGDQSVADTLANTQSQWVAAFK